MKYMLLIYSSEADMQSLGEPERNQMIAAYGAYTQAIMQSGALPGQQPAAAIRLRPPPCASRMARRKCSTGRMPKRANSLPATT